MENNEVKKAVYDLYGRIDLTRLGEIVRNHPEMIKKWTDKNGLEHQSISVNIYSKDKDDYGSVAYIKIPCKQDNMKLHKNAYYLGDLKICPDPNANHIGGDKYVKREDYIPTEKKNDGLPF